MNVRTKWDRGGDHIVREECPVCGEVFYITTEEWAYKRRRNNLKIYFCSWHCLLAYDKDERRYLAPSIAIPAKAMEIGKTLEANPDLSLNDIAKQYGISHTTAWRYFEYYKEMKKKQRDKK